MFINIRLTVMVQMTFVHFLIRRLLNRGLEVLNSRGYGRCHDLVNNKRMFVSQMACHRICKNFRNKYKMHSLL